MQSGRRNRRCSAIGVALLLGTLVASAALRPPPASGLDAAMDRLIQSIDRARAAIRSHPFYQGDAQQAAGIAHLNRMIVRTVEDDVLMEPDFPYFRVVDFRIREGGDNPDQRYLIASIRGGERYRIWGARGTLRRLEFQVYSGLPWDASGGVISSALAFEDLPMDAAGNFSIEVAPTRVPGQAWLENPASGTMVMVRQIFSDWSREAPGEIHIDRVGHEGDLKPVLDSATLAARLDRAATNLYGVTVLWPEFVRTRYLERMPPNELSAPFDPAALGGVKGRWMSVGHFHLEPDEALILTTWPTSANYQGIQLTDLWFASLEYANRVTSLSADQSYRSADGAFHYVVSPVDPGVQNWLDTSALQRGVFLLRYDGMRGEPIAKDRWPRLRKVKIANLRRVLPSGTPEFTAADRARQLAERRRHVQRRFGV